MAAAAEQYLRECFAACAVPRASELAARLGLTPWGLTRSFERSVGVRPSLYLKRAQLERALALLRETTLSATIVARCAAFGSARSLHRSFRRLTRSTPATYRRRTSEERRGSDSNRRSRNRSEW
jgi:transcriptional regulator GlxA family with amidase domain